MEDDLQEWRIRYTKDRAIVQYTFDYHAEGSDAASEWHFCDDCEAHPSAPPEDAEKHGQCDMEELLRGEQGLDSAKAAAPRRSDSDQDTSRSMEFPIAPTTSVVVDHDVIIITDSDSDDSD